MKSKKRKSFLIIIILVLVALVAAAVYFFQFNQYGYIMTIPYRSAFTAIADHVYINKTNARDHQEILDLIKQAEERDRSFWGDLRYLDETFFIICDDENLIRKIGEDHASPFLSLLKSTISVFLTNTLNWISWHMKSLTRNCAHASQPGSKEKYQHGLTKDLPYKTTTVRDTAKNNGYHRPATEKTLSPLRTWTPRRSFMPVKLKTGVSAI